MDCFYPVYGIMKTVIELLYDPELDTRPVVTCFLIWSSKVKKILEFGNYIS